MLKAVGTVALLAGRHAHPGLNVEVVVYPLNIGIHMVHRIVLGIPHVAAAPHHVEGEGCETVEPRVLAEAAVSTVVHHIEADEGNDAAHKHALQHSPGKGRCEKHQVRVQGYQAGQQDNGFA